MACGTRFLSIMDGMRLKQPALSWICSPFERVCLFWPCSGAMRPQGRSMLMASRCQRRRLPKEVKVNEGSPDRLEFRDPYQITWKISVPGNEFRMSDDWADRWLRL